MNPVMCILCTIGAIVVYVIIVFFLSTVFIKVLDMDISDDYDIIMTANIVQFFIAMIVISAYFSGFMGDGV